MYVKLMFVKRKENPGGGLLYLKPLLLKAVFMEMHDHFYTTLLLLQFLFHS